MSDLVERLRELSGSRYPDDICGKELMGKSADRIEQLERVLEQARGAMDSASKTAKFERQPFRHWHLECDEAIAAIDEALK